jgi:hypothetical protein
MGGYRLILWGVFGLNPNADMPQNGIVELARLRGVKATGKITQESVSAMSGKPTSTG